MSGVGPVSTLDAHGLAPATVGGPLPAGAAPLSYGQHRMWLLSELADDAAALNLVMAVRLTGRLNLVALRQAFDDVVARHEVLRSVIVVQAGEAVQVPGQHRRMPVRLLRLDGLPASVAHELTDRVMREEVHRPFDLARGPVARVTALARSETDHLVIVAMHHAVTDGWSMNLLVQELSSLYGAYLAGQPGPLRGTPPVQYRDFARWQRGRADALASEFADRIGQLRGLAGGGLPLDRRPTGERTRVAGIWRCALPPSLVNRLAELRRREGGSLFMLLLTALMVVISRVDGRDEVAVGTLSSGRTRPEFEPILGYCGNVLVIRAGVGGTTFREAWRRVREQCVVAYSHQDLPYERLLEQLNPDRGSQPVPPVSVLCVMQQPAPALMLPGLTAEAVDVPHPSARFDLTLEIRERPGTVELAFQYDSDLLDTDTVALLGRHVRGVLHSAVSDLDTACADLALELPGARASDNQVPASTPQPRTGGTLVELFERQVARSPDAVAVTHGGRAVSYARLNAAANRLARRLAVAGVGIDDRVGVCLPRSLESVVAVLAVLKAGAGYVPLSPADPPARLAELIGDSQAGCVLTTAELRERIGEAAPVLLLDSAAAAAGVAPAAGDLRRSLSPDNLAYLLYTSGSTGVPKGVLGTHGAMVRRLEWGWRQWPYREGERACHRTWLGFVDSVTELFGPLLAGVPVEIVDDDELVEPRRLVGTLARTGITRMIVVPSLLRMMLDSVPGIAGELRSPAVWVCSGERLPTDLAARFHIALPGHTLLNLYGSTEVAGDATAAEVAAGTSAVPIGYPIDAATAQVRESAGHPAAPLVAGELWVGGATVARGYHRRAAATAARFVPDPQGPPGARAFRTGDRVRAGADGALHFLGRLDDQLQVRGVRVEPGEIEDVLRRHPAVSAAAVTARPDGAGTTALVAYVVQAQPCPTASLLSFLRDRLPPHFVPTGLVSVPALPYTASGKIDRRRLPLLGEGDPVQSTAARAPHDDAERAVAEVFAELLPVRWRGVDDDFFALGGHSILAVAVVERLRERCGVQLGIRDIFAARTIAGIAQRLPQGHADPEPPPATAGSGEPFAPFPLTDVQQAYWIGRDAGFELGSVATHSYFEVETSDLDTARLQACLRRLVDRHPSLRTVVRADGRQQVLAEVPWYVLPVLDLRTADARECERRLGELRDEMSHQVLPAERWPLFDIRVSRLPGGRARLHVSIDALIADNFSVRILMDELGTLYHEPAARLPPLDLTFRDCVLAERASRASPAYERAQRYWRERLAVLPPGPELPLCRSPAELAEPRFQRLSVGLDPAQWQQLRQRAAASGLTGSGVLLAAFAEVLTAWSARPHYTLTLTLFSRQHRHRDAHRVVGDFTSLTLLEVDHRAAGTFLDRARRLQQRMWEDLDHRMVSGVAVMREWIRLRGGRPGLLAPVVFTSNLDLDPDPGSDGSTRQAHRLGEIGYALTQTPQLYLDHQVAETAAGLSLTWDVVAELFPPGSVDAMLAAYRDLLAALADRESTWRSPVRGLLPASQQQRRTAVNATTRPRASARLDQLVAEAAGRNPDATAVVAADQRMTYRELAGRSARIAHRLRALGVRRGELVGVAARKGWQQVVAVLGITASGAAYVPLDPDLPPARVAQLREQTGLRTVLVQAAPAGTGSGLAGLAGSQQLVVDDEPTWSGQPDSWPESWGGDRDLAYVIFTSGSTGIPKGVVIDHHGAVNTILDINRRFGIGPHDRVLGLSSLSFDLSVYDIFGMLAAGGTLVLPEPDRLRDPGHWLALVAREGVTTWNSVPALLGLAAEAAGADSGADLGTLRRVLLSGDWIPLDLPDRFRRLAPECEVTSLGGATEGSIWSVCYPVGKVSPDWGSIPYGRPLANQQLYVLDGCLRPRPDWVPGDLYIGGDGVAVGYWADPATTAGSFVPHPDHGLRLYRTGDLARYRPDGDLEFLGRADRQVKISGYRVELGEVEAALRRVPGVAAAAVVAAGPPRGERRLAAYYVAESGVALNQAELRERLRAMLPAYLVPATVTPLAALPLTSNGKVDHAALVEVAAAAQPARAGATRADGGSDGTLRSSLARLWAEVLGVAQVEPADNFFELGGTSLVAVRLLGKLEAAYRVKIPLVRLYEAPTVAQLASEIAALARASGQQSTDQPSVAPQPLTADPDHQYEPFPLTPVQEAYWLGRRRTLPLGGVATHSYVELDVAGLDVDRLEEAVQALVARHDALRTVVQPDGYQRVLAEVPVYRIHRTDLSGLAPARSRAVLGQLRAELSHQLRPADRWPLFDIRATRLDAQHTRLHIGTDLLVVDALSFRTLQHELLALYRSRNAPLPPLRCTFRDYVLAAQRLRDSGAHRDAERYWTERLTTLPPPPPLPQRDRLAAATDARFVRAEGMLDQAQWAVLKQRAAARNLTPSGLLCAAFADVLAMWSQCARFTLNLTTFDRQPLHPDVDALVGDFTSTTLLAVAATGATFAARAGHLQQQLFQDLQHRQFGGVEVLRRMRTDPSRRAGALAPIVFTSMLVPEPPAATAPLVQWDARPVYSVSQTPQVLLDHQVYEHDGTLRYSWDYLAAAFPSGLIAAMFEAYGRLLRSLLTDGAYWEVPPAWTQ